MKAVRPDETAPVFHAGVSDEEALALAEAVASTSWAWEEGDRLMFRIMHDLAVRQVARGEFGPRTEAYLRRMTDDGGG